MFDDKILENKKLLPSINGDFQTLDNLFYDNNTNNDIKNAIIYYIERDLNNHLLNNLINIKNLKIKNYDNNDLIEKIINYFKSDKNEDNKFYISKILLDFEPLEELNKEETNKIFKK